MADLELQQKAFMLQQQNDAIFENSREDEQSENIQQPSSLVLPQKDEKTDMVGPLSVK